MRATINVLVGKSEGKPVLMLQINSDELESKDLELDFSMQEAQHLGTAILVSCGVALERAKP